MDKKLILVIDPSPKATADVQRVCGMILPHIRVSTSNDPRAAIKSFLTEELPDLIVMEFMMAGITGLQMIAAMQRSLRCRKIPVIIWTNTVDQETNNLLVAAGAKKIVRKSDPMAQLIASIKKYLGV
jgi:CheY-like chemotaxis protein